MRHTKKALALLVLGTISTTHAQDRALEEIIVTAQKRSQSLQDVPISVSAVSGDMLQAMNRNEIFDLGRTVAGFSFKSGTSDADKAIQIRGVGTATFSRGVEQTVGTVIDGVVSGSVVAGLLDFNGVERVEVLRGPQGMLFGKNASAGLLNITTHKPSDQFKVGGFLSYGDENDSRLNAYVSGPITDSISGRLEGYRNDRDAWVENLAPGGVDHHDKEEVGVKAKLLFEPSDDLSVYFIYSHAKREQTCCGIIVAAYTTAEQSAGQLAFGPDLLALNPNVGPENDKMYALGDAPGETELDVFSLEVNYDIGDYTLTSITSQTEIEILGNVTSALPLPLVSINRGFDEISQFTQELRITSPSDDIVSFVAGLYYYKNELLRDFDRVQDLTVVGIPIIQSLENDVDMETTSMSVFGQATWNINDTTRLSLGLRYNDEEITKYHFIGAPQIPQGPLNPSGAPALPEAAPGESTGKITDDAVSARFILERDFNDSSMVYASIARGYKGPGANTLTSGLTREFVGAEKPTNIELGMKSEWLSDRLRVNGSLFHTTFEDFQASAADVTTIPAVFFLQNAGEMETKGLELELAFQATENWLVSGNVTRADSEYKEFRGAACFAGQTVGQGCVDNVQDLSGTKLPFAADLTFNLFSRYDIALGSLPFGAYVQGSYHWQDEVQLSTNNDPVGLIDSYGLLDLALGIESDSGNWGVQLWVKNATDEFYRAGFTRFPVLGIQDAGILEYDYTRRVGVSLRVDF